MADAKLDLSAIPTARRDAFAAFAELLRELAGEKLLGLCATGGWLIADPLFEPGPARSVAVFEQVDLAVLENLARHGPRLGKQRIATPLIMTPAYIRASCDAFPLELLEIQQLHARVLGDDFFSRLDFLRSDVRLACERELKSELIHLRQGLLASAGRFELLHELCMTSLLRSARILRGVLHLLARPAPQRCAEMIASAAEATRLNLEIHARLATIGDDLGLDGYRRFYAEVDALAAHVDSLPLST